LNDSEFWIKIQTKVHFLEAQILTEEAYHSTPENRDLLLSHVHFFGFLFFKNIFLHGYFCPGYS
jgi:hypothetical protein